jgi:SAM-dependent methyltransferase
MKDQTTQSKTDFDAYADDYEKLHKSSIKLSGFEPSYFDEHKIRVVYNNHKPTTTSSLQILNFGCGIGKSEEFFNIYFKDCKIHAVDVSQESINIAKERNKHFNNITFIKFDDVDELPLENKFNIIFVANVFHHVPETLHLHILKRLHSFLATGGKIYIFEHNPINPLTKKAFKDCEFDVGCTMIPSKELKQLCKKALFQKISINYVLFFPKILSFLSRFEKYMTLIPIGAQYYIKGEKNAR